MSNPEVAALDRPAKLALLTELLAELVVPSRIDRDEYLTPEEVAAVLRLDTSTEKARARARHDVLALTRQPDGLPRVQTTRSAIRIRRSDLDAYMARRATVPSRNPCLPDHDPLTYGHQVRPTGARGPRRTSRREENHGED